MGRAEGKLKSQPVRYALAAALCVAANGMSASIARAQTPLPTTINDFFLRGTQPGSLTSNISTHTACLTCHNNADGNIGKHWQGSIMAHAGRDPLFYACLDVANHVSPGSGDLCIRCHMPKAWLEGRSNPTDASATTAADRDSITCNFCHRNVDPMGGGEEPPGDAAILAALIDGPPLSPGNGGYVVDPTDLRRGPFTDSVCGNFHPFAVSPLFSKSALCGTCHDVSNPAFEKQGDGTYKLGTVNTHHATGNKLDMKPVERTYSEWLNSAYAVPPGVDAGGRFGGPGQSYVSTCQDCHLPDTTAKGCTAPIAPVRSNMPQHMFNGAANWVLDAIQLKYGPTGNNELSAAQMTAINEAKLRNADMLSRAATLTTNITSGGAQLRVRVTNETGHKLPSGYPEGRRVWLNIQFRDCTGALIAERGGYDTVNATLDTASTKVYEVESGFDEDVGNAIGLPAGHSFFFTLNNVVLKDNRIPPRGFTNAAFNNIQASPVDYVYADGQYWDETTYGIPSYAATVDVRLYYQTSSKEYIEFLRDHNPSTQPVNRGTELYELWLAAGKGAPVLMTSLLHVNVALPGDLDGDRDVTVADVPPFVQVLLGNDADPLHVCAADLTGSGVNGDDVQPFVAALLAP